MARKAESETPPQIYWGKFSLQQDPQGIQVSMKIWGALGQAADMGTESISQWRGFAARILLALLVLRPVMLSCCVTSLSCMLEILAPGPLHPDACFLHILDVMSISLSLVGSNRWEHRGDPGFVLSLPGTESWWYIFCGTPVFLEGDLWIPAAVELKATSLIVMQGQLTLPPGQS